MKVYYQLLASRKLDGYYSEAFTILQLLKVHTLQSTFNLWQVHDSKLEVT